MAGTDGTEEEEHGTTRRSMRRTSGQGRRGERDRGREGITSKAQTSYCAEKKTLIQSPKGGFNQSIKKQNK
jgi:hypothetical protein